MELTDRKKKILRAIVESYIQTAEPVGSKYIAQMPDLAYSSATIRNEMADLTAMGYLEQPHTSAGRVPSPAGYRLYIDELMQDYRLSVDETQSMNQAMQLRMQEFDTMISQVGKIVSNLTNLPAYAMAPLAQQRQDRIAGDAGQDRARGQRSRDNLVCNAEESIGGADLFDILVLCGIQPQNVLAIVLHRIQRRAHRAAVVAAALGKAGAAAGCADVLILHVDPGRGQAAVIGMQRPCGGPGKSKGPA